VAGKRSNGEGTIYRRKDGRFEAAVYLLTTGGTRKRIRIYAPTRQEAQAKLVDAQAKAQHGIPVPDRAWRLGEYLDYWVKRIVEVNQRPATYAQCERVVRLYLKPGLGKLLLEQLSVRTVQGFLDQKLGEKYSVPNVQVMRKVLSAALTNAMREEYTTRNVARLTRLPSYEPDDTEPWTADEARRFLGVSRTEELYPAFLLLVLYGLRRGEVLGLRWCDVDFAQGVLRVRQQLERVGPGLQLGPLKTRAGKRDLPLLNFVRDVLLEHSLRQAKARTALGDASDTGLVFTAERGQPMEASRLVRSFHRVCDRNGIRRIRVHDTRDSLGTLLQELGIPVKQAQVILGHSRATTTLQYYQHGRLEKRRASLEQVAAALLPGIEKDDTGACRPASDGSRQANRQAAFFEEFLTTPDSGAGEGTLTPGLILGKSTEASLIDRTINVKLAMRNRTRCWLVGLVAVSLAVKIDYLLVDR
jgi:integrase